MATIALYANKVNQLPDLIKNVKNSVSNYKEELSNVKKKTLTVNKSVCDLDEVIRSIQSSTVIQENKMEYLVALKENSEEFISITVKTDGDVADVVNQRKEEFYEKYYYLKPECEKNTWEKIKDNCKKFGDWCKEHWKTIVATIAIVIGAVLAILAVIATGGMALVPLLASLLTTIGISAGTAMTIATIASITVAIVAVLSTIGSSTLNIISLWFNTNNSTFNTWKKILNWTSMISNAFYSVGSIYCGIKGISNSSLRAYGKSWITDSGFRNAVLGARNYDFVLNPNTSTFWAGLGKDGAEVAKNYANNAGRTSLEKTIEELGIKMPEWSAQGGEAAWRSASASIAMNSSGKTLSLLGPDVGKVMPWGEVGKVWLHTESILLNINPMITNVSKLVNFGTISQVLINTPRTFQFGTSLLGLSSGFESGISYYFNKDE